MKRKECILKLSATRRMFNEANMQLNSVADIFYELFIDEKYFPFKHGLNVRYNGM